MFPRSLLSLTIGMASAKLMIKKNYEPYESDFTAKF